SEPPSALADPTRATRILTGPSVVARAGTRGAILGGAILDNIKDDVVRSLRVSTHARNTSQLIEAERIADFPRDHMVSTRCVAAHPKPAHSDAIPIDGEPTPEHIHAAHPAADHGIP